MRTQGTRSTGENIQVPIGNLGITLTKTQVREACRTAIRKMGASTLLRHDVSERGIEQALDEFMMWLIIPTLEEIR